MSPSRWVAFEILTKVDEGYFSSVLLAGEAKRLEPSDRALCHELVLGVLRRQLYLDSCIEHFANKKLAKLDRPVLLALRLALYQLRFLTRIPASAAVDEAVKLVQAARLSSARTFVNAVLRRATREPDYDPTTLVADRIEKLSIETSHPHWLIERWVSSFGLEETYAFARSNNETPATAFRVIQSRADEADVFSRLRSAGVVLEPSSIAPGAWRTPAGSRIVRELAENGEIYLQDEASQMVAEMVDARDDHRVLDLCSAPGGKTTLIADRSAAFLVASDVSKRRLATLLKSVVMQNLKRVSLMVLDAMQQLPFADAPFDRVLVDAPCSGTGTLRHNPEIRWRLKPQDFPRLAAQQTQLLQNASKVLKPGGRLVYSTCSVELEENEAVATEFLKRNDGYRPLHLKPSWGVSSSAESLRTWPHRQGTDGFFVTAFEKVQ